MEQEVLAGALLVQADTLKRVAAAALYEILGRMSYQADVSVRRLAAGMNLDEASLGQDFGAGGDRADDIVAVLAIGICIGGRLSVRAALNPDVSAGPCFCASDIQNRCLGQGMKDDSLDRVGDRGELLIISGRQDQHIPREGRERIQAMDEDAVTRLSWVKVNGHPLASERPAVTTEPATGEADGSE